MYQLTLVYLKLLSEKCFNILKTLLAFLPADIQIMPNKQKFQKNLTSCLVIYMYSLLN